MDVIHTAEFDSPIGSLRIASTSIGLAYIQLPHANGRGFDGWRTRHAPAAQAPNAARPARGTPSQAPRPQLPR